MEKTSSLGAATKHRIALSGEESTATQSRATWFASISNATMPEHGSDAGSLTHQVSRDDAANSARRSSVSSLERLANAFRTRHSIGTTATQRETSFTQIPGDDPESSSRRSASASKNADQSLFASDASSPLLATTLSTRAPRPWQLFREAGQQLDLILINAETDEQASLRQLESLQRKNHRGEFELGQKVQYLMTFGLKESQPLGIALNVLYLKTLRSLAQADGTEGAHRAAQLLRSPDSDKSWITKGLFEMAPGYYRSVLKHAEDFPELAQALKSLVDDLAQQGGQLIARRTAKMHKDLLQQFSFDAATTLPAESITEIRQALKDLQSRNLALAGGDAAHRQAYKQ